MGNRLSMFDQIIEERVAAPSTHINTSLGDFELFPKDAAVLHYIDGREKPHLRGCLHFIASYSIPVAILLRLVNPSSVKWVYLLGKLVPYLTSVFHHFYDFKTVGDLELVRRMDSRMMHVSIAVSGLCFSNVNYLWHLAMCGVGICYDKCAVKCVYALVSMLSLLWSDIVPVNLWCLMMVNYAAACVVFNRKISGKPEMVHHTRKWWGVHEDFHLLVLIGDMVPLLL
jgi:predicted membrane channel-forming protein YqfA (hemolysin III family)